MTNRLKPTRRGGNEETSPEVATLAGRVLRDRKATPREKKLAASALTQAQSKCPKCGHPTKTHIRGACKYLRCGCVYLRNTGA